MDKFFGIIKRIKAISIQDAIDREKEAEIVSVTEIVPETKQYSDAIGVDSIGFYQQEDLDDDD